MRRRKGYSFIPRYQQKQEFPPHGKMRFLEFPATSLANAVATPHPVQAATKPRDGHFSAIPGHPAIYSLKQKKNFPILQTGSRVVYWEKQGIKHAPSS